MDLSSDCFIQKDFRPDPLAYISNIAKESEVLSHCLVKCILCLLDGGY